MLVDEFQKNKKFLKRYKPYKRNIDRLEQRLFELDVELENLKSPQLSGMLKGSPQMRDLTKRFDKKTELNNRINKLNEEGQPIKDEILDVIDHLENSHQAEVLELYFIGDIGLIDIANQLSYSFRQASRLYGNGVMAIKR